MPTMNEHLLVVTIYENPRDYPGKFVARRFWIGVDRSGPRPEPEPLAVADSLDEIRAAIPQDMVCLGREPYDEPQIVESWV
jgi:hypothetical protein